MHKVEQCRDPLEWILLTDMETYLPDDELRKADRLSMWHSLEVRVPFLDHKLVEFVATIPSHLKLKGWEKKHILIKVMEGFFLNRSCIVGSRASRSLLGLGCEGLLRDLMYAHISTPHLRELGMFNEKSVERMLAEHTRGQWNHETKIWALLSFMLWVERYMRGQAFPAVK
ncbi:MAG: hypothetical protein IPK92_15350 [Nitrospira sp.]|nr:hypothetical protein [Nitrospira sp.]